ncbi:MAG: hypothetical protein HY842_02990 [Bacteroidetes bacterium]|nr:hypothetical protein [Bacteroidota bacterium]
MPNELNNLKRKVQQYKEVLANTENYRLAWKEHLKSQIINMLEALAKEVELPARVEERSTMENMETIILSLGAVKSGMFHKIDQGLEMPVVKHNGSLVYQQLFNGKIIVFVQYPFIENYGEPRPPRTIAIYRPEELQEPFILRHFEEFISEITAWEDYDDDEPAKKIGFEMNLGGIKPA